MANQLDISVGVPHVKSRIKDIRNSSYSIYIAILDIMDNVEKGYTTRILFNRHNNYVKNIIIMDNDKEGFKNILKEGVNNPLNMGHINDSRHQDDKSNSEYGIGLKAGGVFLGDRLTIYTRINENCYVKAILDFNQMCEEVNPMKSYDPNIYLIEEDEYRKNHNFEYGSTIILDELRHILCYEIFWDKLKHQINHTYNYQIRNDGKIIEYKGEHDYISLKPLKILEESPLCKKRMRTTMIYFNDDFTNMYAVVHIDGTFDASYVINSNGNIAKDKLKNYTGYETNKIVIKSTSIYCSKFDDETSGENLKKLEYYENMENEYRNTFIDVDNNYSLPFASCFIYRDNRCFGTFPFTKLLNGDTRQNHTIHQIFYENKKYNLYFGVNSSKGNLVKRDCKLIDFMEGVLKKIQVDLGTANILKHESTIQVKEEQAEKKKIEALKKEENKKIEALNKAQQAEPLNKAQQVEAPKKEETQEKDKTPYMSNEQFDKMIKVIIDNKNDSLTNPHLIRYFNENCLLRK